MKNSIIALTLMSISPLLLANTRMDPHLPIDHCYHWLDEQSSGYLTHKYQYANANSGELTFVTTPGTSNGAIAGPGLYCAKSPSGSYTYGDRLIRVELVDDVVLYDDYNNVNYCRVGNKFIQDGDCQSKDWDIKFYRGGGVGNYAWYVISNPQAVKSWSANSDQLIQDLNNSKTVNSLDSVFDSVLDKIEAERDTLGVLEFANIFARASLSTIIQNEPEKLATYPAINLLKRAKSEGLAKTLPKATYDKFISDTVLRVLADWKLSYSDVKGDLIGNSFVNGLVQDVIQTKISNKETDLNFSIAAYFILNKANTIKVSKKYMEDLTEEMLKNHPWKLGEIFKEVKEIGSWFEEKVRKDFKSVIIETVNKQSKSLGDLNDANLVDLVSLLDEDEFFSSKYKALREDILTTKLSKVQLLDDSNSSQLKISVPTSDGNVDIIEYRIDKATSETITNACQVAALYTKDAISFEYNGDSGSVTIDKRIKSVKDAKKLCKAVLNKSDTITYTAQCSRVGTPGSFKFSDSANDSFGKVKSSSMDGVINACKKKIQKDSGVGAMNVLLEDLEPEVTGKNIRYRGECFVTRDDSIGMVAGNSLDDLNKECKKASDALGNFGYGTYKNNSVSNIEVLMREGDHIRAACFRKISWAYFYDKTGFVSEVTGDSVDSVISSCSSLVDSIYGSDTQVGITNFDYEGDDYNAKGKCLIERSDLTYIDQVTLKGSSHASLANSCQKIATEMNSGYISTYKKK